MRTWLQGLPQCEEKKQEKKKEEGTHIPGS